MRRPLRTAASAIKKYLTPLVDGRPITLSAVLASALILMSSYLAPQAAFVSALELTGTGQNTALGLFALSCAIFLSPRPARRVLANTLTAISLLLALTALLQYALDAYPADGWIRVIANTQPGEEQDWPGRMSRTTAFIIIAYSLTLLFPSKEHNLHLALKIVSIGAGLLTAFASVTSHLLGAADVSSYAFLSLPTASILTLHGAVLIRRLSARLDSLQWEAQHPGEAIFIRVLMPLSLLLTAAAVAILNNVIEQQLVTAILAFSSLCLLVVVIIYRYIVGAVNNRQKAERQLAEREAALEQAQAQALLGSWQLNIQDNTLSCSAQCLRTFGLAPGAPFSIPIFMTYVHSRDRAYVRKHWLQGLRGSPLDIEYRILISGSIKWVHCQATLISDQNKTPISVQGTIQDITQLKAKELELLLSREKVRKLAARNEQIREQERRRLARELHDEMGQHLTALRLDTAMAQMRNNITDAELQTILSGLKKGIDTLIRITRDTASSLRPPALDYGLVAAIEWLLPEFEARTGIQSDLRVDIGDIELDDDLRTAAFRIIQESLTNVIKHAEATEVHIRIFLRGDNIKLSITDNGRGFNTADIREDQCFGLTGIRERIMMLGGEYLIDSQLGQGTRLLVSFPIR